MQNQPVMRVLTKFSGYEFQQPVFHSSLSLARRQAGAIADAENMRVDGHCRLAEGDVEHDIRGLAADARQGLQRLAAARRWVVRGLAAPAVAWLWWSSGLLLPALRPTSPAHRSRTSPGNTGNEPPAASPRKESTLETPADPLPPLPVPRRESRLVPVAVPPRRPCLPGTDASAAPRLCRLPRVL